MRRSAVLFLMLLAMLWQSLAQARPGSTINVLADPEHAALHWLQEEHHHHDDGSFHLDDSQASTFHLASDHLAASIAWLPTGSAHVIPSASVPPGRPQRARVPDPFVDGLLRPPRRQA